MVQHGRSGVYLTVQKLMLATLLVVLATFSVEPSTAAPFCICPEITYCSFVTTSRLVISGSVTRSCLKVYQEEESEPIATTCEGGRGGRRRYNSSTTWEDEEEDEYSEGAYFVSEYELKIYNVYKDDLNFTYPNTPRAVEFFSSGLDIDSCRLDLDVGNELVVDLYEEEDGSFSSYVCSATRAIEFLSEDDIECLESGGYS